MDLPHHSYYLHSEAADRIWDWLDHVYGRGLGPASLRLPPETQAQNTQPQEAVQPEAQPQQPQAEAEETEEQGEQGEQAKNATTPRASPSSGSLKTPSLVGSHRAESPPPIPPKNPARALKNLSLRAEDSKPGSEAGKPQK